ncbi:MAG TPA: metalloregulator ArsR/SmtB family transcription factor [Parvibaculum sp.]|jgi:DNA-binding transcriptional ArsR family regulator
MTQANLDQTLIALADPTRRQVIELLRQGPRRAGELVASSTISAPAMSRHLRILRASGLIEETEVPGDARVRLYRLRPEQFANLQSWLEEVQGFWAGQLDAFKAHVERKTQKPKGGRR